MENARLEEKNITKDVRNLFILEKLQKQTTDTTIKDIRNLFSTEESNKEIKDRILGDIRTYFRLKKWNKRIKDIIPKSTRNLFENEEGEHYYKPVRVSKCSNNYIKYKSNSDRNKILSAEEHI